MSFISSQIQSSGFPTFTSNSFRNNIKPLTMSTIKKGGITLNPQSKSVLVPKPNNNNSTPSPPDMNNNSNGGTPPTPTTTTSNSPIKHTSLKLKPNTNTLSNGINGGSQIPPPIVQNNINNNSNNQDGETNYDSLSIEIDNFQDFESIGEDAKTTNDKIIIIGNHDIKDIQDSIQTHSEKVIDQQTYVQQITIPTLPTQPTTTTLQQPQPIVQDQQPIVQDQPIQHIQTIQDQQPILPVQQIVHQPPPQPMAQDQPPQPMIQDQQPIVQQIVQNDQMQQLTAQYEELKQLVLLQSKQIQNQQQTKSIVKPLPLDEFDQVPTTKISNHKVFLTNLNAQKTMGSHQHNLQTKQIQAQQHNRVVGSKDKRVSVPIGTSTNSTTNDGQSFLKKFKPDDKKITTANINTANLVSSSIDSIESIDSSPSEASEFGKSNNINVNNNNNNHNVNNNSNVNNNVNNNNNNNNSELEHYKNLSTVLKSRLNSVKKALNGEFEKAKNQTLKDDISSIIKSEMFNLQQVLSKSSDKKSSSSTSTTNQSNNTTSNNNNNNNNNLLNQILTQEKQKLILENEKITQNYLKDIHKLKEIETKLSNEKDLNKRLEEEKKMIIERTNEEKKLLNDKLNEEKKIMIDKFNEEKKLLNDKFDLATQDHGIFKSTVEIYIDKERKCHEKEIDDFSNKIKKLEKKVENQKIKENALITELTIWKTSVKKALSNYTNNDGELELEKLMNRQEESQYLLEFNNDDEDIIFESSQNNNNDNNNDKDSIMNDLQSQNQIGITASNNLVFASMPTGGNLSHLLESQNN